MMLLIFVIGLLAVTGCAPRQSAAPIPPPAAALGVTYQGVANGSCGANQPAHMSLTDGKFILSAGGEELRGVAAADGALSGNGWSSEGRPVNFSGRIQGEEMRGGSYNGRCGFAFLLRKIQ
jgi:hypothetical protein